VRFAVAANPGPPRTATITAGGQRFTVTQEGGCAYSLSAAGATAPPSGGAGSVDVATTAGCTWTAATSDAWITVTAGSSGSGPGSVQYTVAANSGPARVGTITIGGQPFRISQDTGCVATVAPEAIAAPASGASRDVTVTTDAGCAWTAASAADWISIRSGAGGTGNGSVQFDVAANTGPARTGTLTVASRVVTVTQDSGCTVSISPASQPVAVGGGTGTVTVTAGSGCTWTATSNVAWIAVTAGASGSGNGSVQFSAEANATGAGRTGTITIAGQTFTVEQAGTL
jgi:hypothetical protein